MRPADRLSPAPRSCAAAVYRQKAGTSGYETVDGEGILHQSQNGNPGYGCVGGEGIQDWAFCGKHCHWQPPMSARVVSGYRCCNCLLLV